MATPGHRAHVVLANGCGGAGWVYLAHVCYTWSVTKSYRSINLDLEVVAHLRSLLCLWLPMSQVSHLGPCSSAASCLPLCAPVCSLVSNSNRRQLLPSAPNWELTTMVTSRVAILISVVFALSMASALLVLFVGLTRVKLMATCTMLCRCNPFRFSKKGCQALDSGTTIVASQFKIQSIFHRLVTQKPSRTL
jgi:hypothetical protein